MGLSGSFCKCIFGKPSLPLIKSRAQLLPQAFLLGTMVRRVTTIFRATAAPSLWCGLLPNLSSLLGQIGKDFLRLAACLSCVLFRTLMQFKWPKHKLNITRFYGHGQLLYFQPSLLVLVQKWAVMSTKHRHLKKQLSESPVIKTLKQKGIYLLSVWYLVHHVWQRQWEIIPCRKNTHYSCSEENWFGVAVRILGKLWGESQLLATPGGFTQIKSTAALRWFSDCQCQKKQLQNMQKRGLLSKVCMT